MPSGSKKRKAARKKKENQSGSNHSNGRDDVKQQDDKDSDVGELSSPNSHDHDSHQSHLTEGEEEENDKKGENISHTPAEKELKTKDGVEDDAVVPVDREFEIEDKSSNKDDGSSSGSSGDSDGSRSSSDDESNFIKKGEAAIDITPIVDLGNGNESLSGEPDNNIVGAEIDDGVDSVVENSPAEELKNTLILGDKLETDTCIAPYTIEPMESEVKRLGFVEDNGISKVSMDVPLKKDESIENIVTLEDNGISKVSMDVPLKKDESIENIVTLDHKECVTQESHDRVPADIGVELKKDSGVTEVLLVPAPPTVETTTWKSCCGLFEMFAESRR